MAKNNRPQNQQEQKLKIKKMTNAISDEAPHTKSISVLLDGPADSAEYISKTDTYNDTCYHTWQAQCLNDHLTYTIRIIVSKG